MPTRSPVPALLSRVFSARGGRRRKPRPAACAPERLEPRLALAADLLSVAAARPEAPGFPAHPELPIPAGATLIDISDSGLHALFSSPDPNIVPGQQTVPFLPGAVGNLFWMDLSAGTAAPVIRLVTSIAGSTSVSAGYTGIGTGLVDPFVPGTADLSGDGQTVVFDSPINAHTFDATVPPENDQPSNARLVVQVVPGQPAQTITVEDAGSIDVFVWRAAAADPAHAITAVSLLNAAGKRGAIDQAVLWGFPLPDASRPMMAGVFPEQPPLGFDPFGRFELLEPTPATTANHGISDDGRRILYSTDVPAPWLDTVNTSPAIADDVDPLVGQGWSVDGFLVDGADAGSAAALEAAGRTLTVTTYDDAGELRALGSYQNQIPWGQGFLPSSVFYPEHLQFSSEGNRVVYSTRVPSATIVPKTTDATFSLDVFAYDVAADTTILVTTRAGQPTVAAGAGQADFPTPQPGQIRATLELFDSRNHSVSRDGLTIAVTSSAGTLTAGLVDNNVTLRPYGAVATGFPVDPFTPFASFTVLIRQQGPSDIFAVRPDSRTAFLVNTPDGVANTNLDATFGGMSADGSTFLFGTAANNFYSPPFASPPFPPFATAPLPPNFILGGFENLWSRHVDEATTTLVSVGWADTASGNRPTLAAAVLPGARDLLPNVSETGRFVMFSTASNTLVPGINDRTFKGGVFVRDMQTGTATLVSTTATGNVPSAGTFREYALAAEENAAGRFRVFLGGGGGGDMQSRFRSEDLPPLDPHIYALDYPVVTPAASATSRDLFSVSGGGPFGRTVVEYRGTQGTIKASPARLVGGFSGEWRTATGDVTGDGVADVVYGAGPGGNDVVIVIDGRTNAEVMRLRAFSDIRRGGGVFVATGDVDRDGFADVIVGTEGRRAARVIVVSGRRGNVIARFSPLGNGRPVRVAARVAGGDVDGDGFADVIVASGPGLKPRAEVYSGRLLTQRAAASRIAAFALSATPAAGRTGDGAFVAAADMTGDGRSELVVSFDGRPTVSVIDGRTGGVLSTVNLTTLPEVGATFGTGARIAARAGRVAIASGPGVAPSVRVLAFRNLAWSVEPLVQPKLGATGTTGLFIG